MSPLFNPQQQIAVEHLNGPILVLAGAGSGKTRIIAHRVARLVTQHHIPPSAIIALSFTNKAANEMKNRIAQLIGTENANQARLSTFHSLGAYILQQHITTLGWKNPFAIIDTADQKNILKDVLKELNLSSSKLDPDILLTTISKAKSNDTTPANLPALRFNPQKNTINKIFLTYQTTLKNLNAIDFDDLILLPNLIFNKFPQILDKYHSQWLYFLVDEYQDTNPPQFRLISSLAKKNNNLMVVGDDDQSIYAFRGADSSHILNFHKHYTDAKIVALEQNYRSTPHILNAANAVIQKNTLRHKKNLWCEQTTGEKLRHFTCRSETEEAIFVIEQIKALRAINNASFSDFAILYRINPQAKPFEDQLLENNLPYKIMGSSKFYDRREIKDLIAYLRACYNHNDELALRRIINVPRRNITANDINAIDELAKSQNTSFFTALQIATNENTFKPLANEKCRSLLTLLNNYNRQAHLPNINITQLLKNIIANINYMQFIQSSASTEEQAQKRLKNIDELFKTIENFQNSEKSDLYTFLQRVALEPPQSDDEQNDDKITLMTLHASKGLEFPFVFIVGCEENLLPHANATNSEAQIEEERRLCYVGITRAKKLLTLSSCKTRQSHSEMINTQPSRFIKDIPPELIDNNSESTEENTSSLQAIQQKQNRIHLNALKDAIMNKK